MPKATRTSISADAANADSGAAASTVGRTSAHRADRAFVVLATTQATLIFTIGVISVPLPAIQRDLALSNGELALLNTAFGLSFSGLLLLGGRITDLTGRRRTFRLGVGVFGITSGLAAFAPTMEVLLAARFAQGAGAALAAPAAMALLGSIYPDPARRGRAVAIWGGVSSAGAISGVLLSGVISAAASWRGAFAIPAAVALIAVLTAPRLLPPGPASVRARLDGAGAVLATAGISGTTFGLVATLDRSWTSPTVLIPLLGGIGLLMLFLAAEFRVRQPLLPPRFILVPRRAAALLAVLLASAGNAGTGFVLSLYFQQVEGWSAARTSAAFLPYLLILPTAVVAGRLVGRVGPRTVTVAGLIVAAAGLLMLGRLTPADPYLGATLAGMLLFPVGSGLTFAGATVAAVEAPEAQAGLAAGVLNTAMEIGPTVGLALLVSAAGAHAARLAEAGAGPAMSVAHGYAFAFNLAAAAFTLAAALAAVAFPKTHPIQTGGNNE